MNISIIIPVYKSRDYIEKCLQSVVEQDYQGDMECILVDDCGPDDSIEVAKRFIEQHTSSKVQFTVLYHEKNRKQSAARNTGMQVAKGDWIYFLDSDDWLTPDALRHLMECADEHPDCDMVQAGIYCTDGVTFPWLRCQNWKEPQLTYTDDRQWIIDTCAARFDMIPMTPVSKLMRRDFLERNEFRFVEGIYHEDELWLARLAKYLHRVAFCHDDSYMYRLHPGSTTDGGGHWHHQDWRQVWIEIFKLFDDHFCPASMRKQIDFDTSYAFEYKTKERRVRWMLVGIKLRLMHYSPWRTKLRYIKWILWHAKALF